MNDLLLFLFFCLCAAAGIRVWIRRKEDPDCGRKRPRPGRWIILILSVLCLCLCLLPGTGMIKSISGTGIIKSIQEAVGYKDKKISENTELFENTDISDKDTSESIRIFENIKKLEELKIVKDIRTAVRGIPEPVFSEESGFYEKPFLLTISAEEGLSVYYTLDCAIPTEDSFLYRDPISVSDRSSEPDRFRSIRNVRREYLESEEENAQTAAEPVDKAFVVRAVAVNAEGKTSGVVTKTYFVGLEKYRDQTVISLVADPEDLFGAEKGIYVTGAEYDAWYEKQMSGTLSSDAESTAEAEHAPDAENAAETENIPDAGNDPEAEYLQDPEEEADTGREPEVNYRKTGKEWEREAEFTLFRESAVAVNQPVGIRIQGNTSRDYVLKRFSIFSRKEYSGSKWFDAPVFETKKTHSVMTRNSFLNALSMELAKGRNAESQPVMPVVLFLDGEFWYDDYFLLEKYSEEYFAQKYGLRQDNIRMIKTTFWDSVDEENRSIYGELLDYLDQHDMADDEKYAGFAEMADIQSYIDYWCVNLYLDNEDAGETLNVCMWRTDIPENGGKGDGRWRWALQDMDLTWGRRDRGHHGESPWEVNTFSLEDSRKKGEKCRAFSMQPIYLALSRNPSFRRQFVTTFMDLTNTIFRPEAVLEKIARWENEKTNPAYREFFSRRPEYIVPYMAETFGLTGTGETVSLSTSDPEAGTIRLNTIEPDLSEGTWEGRYYTDYPVTVMAVPNPGYRFSCWQIGEEKIPDETAEISFGEGGVSIQAVFEKK